MKEMKSLSIDYSAGTLKLLDQTLLPNKEHWFAVEDHLQMVDAVKKLQVRGAPAIGVAAALCLGKMVEEGCAEELFRQAAMALREARPTAVNLMVAIDFLLGIDFSESAIVAQVEKIFSDDVESCARIASNGAELIADGDGVLTHCNTGGLATAGVGTALGIIAKAHEQGKKIHVYVDETRPLLQGGRLTTWELEKLGIPYTLICDNMAGFLMEQGKVDKVFVGADRIAMNGDFANKVGTYSVAVLSSYHQIPFYVAAPTTTLDPQCPNGGEIPIEQRPVNEVRGVQGSFGQVEWAPTAGEVYNPAFDVTPGNLVKAWILDSGNYTREEIEDGALKSAT